MTAPSATPGSRGPENAANPGDSTSRADEAPRAPGAGGNEPKAPRRRRFRPRRPAWSEVAGVAGLLAVLVAVSLVLVGNIRDHPELSAIDEVGNGDYLFQASHGGMAQLGERLGPEITREMACRGVSYFPKPQGPCPGNGDPASVPGWDVTNSDIHPPTYYYVTAWIGAAILRVAPTDSLITAGRLVNILWLGAGLVLLYLVLRDLR